jgi:hypothetical protein
MRNLLSSTLINRAVVLFTLSILWIFQVLSRFFWTNHYYGRTNIIYFTEDSVCYGYMAYSYAGLKEAFISEMLNIFTLQGNFYTQLQISEMIDSQACRGTQSRILLSWLAHYLIPWFGMNSIWMIPALSWLVMVLICAYILLKQNIYLGTIISGSLAISSSSVTVWAVSAMTDALLMALVFLSLVSFGLFNKKYNAKNIIFCLISILLAALTRQSWPYFMSIGIILILYWLLNRKDNKYLTFGLIYLISPYLFYRIISLKYGHQNGPQYFRDVKSLLSQSAQIDPSVENGISSKVIDSLSLFDRFFSTTWDGPLRQIAIEVQGLLIRDASMVVLVILSFYALVKNYRNINVYFAPGLLFSGVVIGSLNTSAFHFRFILPAVGALMLSSAIGIGERKNELIKSPKTK